jgi:copper(I)-binding protein
MKRSFLAIGILAFILSACGAGATGDIEVHNAWVRPAPQSENAAVYFTIHNHSNTEDELTGASSNVSDNVEIHESKMENDVMKMTMVPSIPLAADEEVNFVPGGYHILLVAIKQEFKAGDHIAVILHFKNHEDIIVNVSVGNDPANSDNHDHNE